MARRRVSNMMRDAGCEGSLTMRMNCKRTQLVALMTILVVVSLASNIFLFYDHDDKLVERSIGAEYANASDDLDTAFRREEDMDQPTVQEQMNLTAAVRKRAASVTVQSLRESVRQHLATKRSQELAKETTTMEVQAEEEKPKPAPAPPRKKQQVRRGKRKPDIAPNPSAIGHNTTFSACLLIKDDNEILNEWLAYHYHVVSLRHLVVAVDPLSSESPSAILQKWRQFSRLNIVEWTDQQFMPPEFLEEGQPPEEYQQKPEDFDLDLSEDALIEISNHRYRQRVFLAKCYRHFRNKGKTWVMHIDTDEFIESSKMLREVKPDYVTIPPIEKPGSILNLLQQVVKHNKQDVSYPCVSMLRVLFGSVESSPDERGANVPDGFNTTAFETLRWKYHAPPEDMSYHGNPKVILDVSVIPRMWFPDDIVYSIHRPAERFCRKNTELSFTNYREQPIAVNHYLGSWERYAGRNDKRRSRSVYDAKANVDSDQDFAARQWLNGFVDEMGMELAAKLLGDLYLLHHENGFESIESVANNTVTS